ncbi:MAG: hypothetical protein HXO56_07905 [Rothia dentocariosa]|uniref:Uncharacterized protein n=1 Tax=Rothia dentocariosa TaxID=2047 RepID=A0A930PE67_9MICC|nr:hypothetical protein [Rothia dentocariosa]
MSETLEGAISLTYHQDEKAAWVELLEDMPFVKDSESGKKVVEATENFIKNGLARVQVKDGTAFDSSEYWRQIIDLHQEIIKLLEKYLAKEFAGLIPDGHELFLNEVAVYRAYVGNEFCTVEDYEVATRKIA